MAPGALVRSPLSLLWTLEPFNRESKLARHDVPHAGPGAARGARPSASPPASASHPGLAPLPSFWISSSSYDSRYGPPSTQDTSTTSCSGLVIRGATPSAPRGQRTGV